MFGWVKRKKNKWWGLCVFSPGPSKRFFPKIERKLGRKSSWNEIPKIPLTLEFTSKSPTCWLFFFFLWFFLSLLLTNVLAFFSPLILSGQVGFFSFFSLIFSRRVAFFFFFLLFLFIFYHMFIFSLILVGFCFFF